MTEKTNSTKTEGSLFGAVKSLMSGRRREALPVGDEQLREAMEDLERCREGKMNLEARIIEDEQWYKRRHWDIMGGAAKQGGQPRPTSAWLFNTLMNKHADASDSYPLPAVLPREEKDRDSARMLSDILPAIMERCDFEQTYSDNWWEKLKHGTAAYGVFWNSEKENGLGDVDIRLIDLLNIFWEPGISDLQRSRRLFITDMWDAEAVEAIYPHAAGRVQTDDFRSQRYICDDRIDLTQKVQVVDCYYKKFNSRGKKVVHLMKFCGDVLLYASENDETYRERGFYDHGQYPVVLDTLFPEKGTPVGFGYVSVCKDPQMYIDRLSANILETSMMATKVRYFALENTGINEDELLDWNRPIVHVEGSSLDENRLKQIKIDPIDQVYVDVLEQKIREMKETSANRDVNAGSSGAGVTAAAAIAALQEAGSKNSRDMIAAAYRAYVKIGYLCIELIRQFYDEERCFRISGRDGYVFGSFSNRDISRGNDSLCPVFDIKVRAQKRSPFSQLSLNEMAKELFGMGVFSPQKAEEGLIMLELMEFEGKEIVADRLQQLCRENKDQPAQEQEEKEPRKGAKNTQLAAREYIVSKLMG